MYVCMYVYIYILSTSTYNMQIYHSFMDGMNGMAYSITLSSVIAKV